MGGGGKREGVMTRHDLVMIWDDMVYILNDHIVQSLLPVTDQAADVTL